jgi:opacity protein-like surface antigen
MQMWKKMLSMGAVALVVVLMLEAIAAAAEEKPANYVVMRLGRFAPTGDVRDAGYDAAQNGELLYGRYLNSFLALEGGFAIMHSEGAEKEPYSVIYDDRDLTIRGFMLSTRFLYPAGKAEIYAGIGIGRWRVSNEVWTRGPGGDFEVTDSIWGYHFLAGANFGFTPYWYLGLEGKQIKFLDFLDVDDITARTASLSIGLRF